MFVRTVFLLYFVEFIRCMESEICFPIKLDDHSDEFDNGVDISFQKRFIKLGAFQQEFVLNLQQDSEFIAPSISVQGAFWIQDPDVHRDLRRCFYSGYVNDDRDSYAALSLCKGLNGAFGFQGWEYFISPVRNGTQSAQQAHVVRRRRIQDLKQNSTSRCAVESDLSPADARSLLKYRHMTELSSLNETLLKRMGRAKRFASVPRYVETLLAADESMVNFHGDDLKHYLLTLMSVAAKLYRHPSILNSISITVVKIVIISEEDKGPKVSGNAAMTLRNFCTWQKKMNKHNDKHPDYWDTAILFTRQVREHQEEKYSHLLYLSLSH